MSTLTPSRRLVAFAVSMHMDGDGGSAFPSARTISAESGLNKSTVLEALAELDADGWLFRNVPKVKGRGRVTRYYATFPWDEKVVPPDHSGKRNGRTGAQKRSSHPTIGRQEVVHAGGGSRNGAAPPAFPLGRCEGCGKERALVDGEALRCAPCIEWGDEP